MWGPAKKTNKKKQRREGKEVGKEVERVGTFRNRRGVGRGAAERRGGDLERGWVDQTRKEWRQKEEGGRGCRGGGGGEEEQAGTETP